MILPACAHVLINDAEARGLAGVDDTESAARAILPSLAHETVLVIKCGPAGALVCQGGERAGVPAPAVAVVDTIGAGDAFNAGYLAATREGCGPVEATERGVRLASLAVSTRPRRYSV